MDITLLCTTYEYVENDGMGVGKSQEKGIVKI